MPVPQGDITTTEIMNQVVVDPEENQDDLSGVQDSSGFEQSEPEDEGVQESQEV